MGAKNGDPLMVVNKFTDYFNIKLAENSYFGEETTIKGWPSSADNGVQFNFGEYISILKPAENPEGAWEFLKYALYNAKCLYGGFRPANLSLLDEIAEEEIEIFSYDGDLRWVRGEVKEVYKGYAEGEIDKLMTLYKSASAIDREDPTISAIIDEEIGSYLSGQRSADTIIDIIENRIAIYLAEQD
jgi:ABC-type glycerol-3-phosphate transport system substrate-binding protein